MKIGTCSIIKDEQEYIEEWIQYNISIGITDIYLYEDIDSKSHKEITDKYSECHLYSILDIPYKDATNLREGSWRQVALYEWFVDECNNKNIELDWCAFIDPDEFITFEDGYDLYRLLDEYNNYPGLYLFWKRFGAAGHIYKQKGKVQDIYNIECENLGRDRGWEYKSLVNFRFKSMNFGVYSPHQIRGGINTSNIPTFKIKSFKKCWINHYFTKSLEDWVWQIIQRGDVSKNNRKLEQFFECNPDLKDKQYLAYELAYKYAEHYTTNDLVSICMCTYNRANYLNNSISSMLNQTYTNTEFIIVDDGSIDNSKEILEYWKEKDSRIKVIYSDHNFIKSRNLAYQNATGKYIINMDSDDICSIYRIEKLYKYLLIHKDVDILANNLNTYYNFPEAHEDLIKCFEENKELVTFGTMMFKRDILKSFKDNRYFLNEFNRGGEDSVFKIQLLNYGYKFAAYQDNTLYIYDKNSTSLSLNDNNILYRKIHENKSLEEIKIIIKDMYDNYPIDDIKEFLLKYNIEL